jgi:ribosomal protein L37AE/L43A
MLLERAVEEEYRPRMLAELQRRVEAAETVQAVAPTCPHCGQAMRRKDTVGA